MTNTNHTLFAHMLQILKEQQACSLVVTYHNQLLQFFHRHGYSVLKFCRGTEVLKKASVRRTRGNVGTLKCMYKGRVLFVTAQDGGLFAVCIDSESVP